jgi:serine/threonine protein kinase
MTPDEPDSDRTQIQPPGFDKTQVFAAPAPARPPSPDMGNGLDIGTRLGEFELIKFLAEGGFGIVYLATDHSLQRQVALKEYMPSSLAARTGESQVQVKSERYRETFEAGLKSFINEARLLASFDHPSLVKVYRFWEANGTAYMVMPFYEGKNLRDTLRGAAQPPDETWLRTLLAPLTEALLVIHAEQCYHRDIAPDNVMMLAGTNRPLLLDFGAARRVIGDMTQALTVILKPGYAPVEQYAEIPGMKQGPWTDVYALAAVVHYAVTGRTPPPSVGRLLNDTYQPLVEVAAGRYSEGFLSAVDRALAVRPEQRTQTVVQFREELGLTGLIAPSTVVLPTLPPLSPTLQPGAPQTLASPMPGRAVPPTAILPPRTERAERADATMQADPRPMPPIPAPKRSGAMLGIGMGAVALAAAGFGVWRMTAGGAAPAPAVAEAPAAPAVARPLNPPAQTPPPPVLAAFEPAREFDRIVQAQTAGFDVKATPVKARLSVKANDEFKFSVTAARDGFVYVIGQNPDGSLALLVPNATSPNARLRKGATWRFPPPKGFYLPASNPPGISRMLVMVSTHERSFDAMAPQAEGPVKIFPTGAPAALLVSQFKGSNSALAGVQQCPAGDAACADEYGAAIMQFDTVP